MNQSSHEQKVVQAFSAITIPEQIVRDSNIRELIAGMVAETKSVKEESGRLERLRKEQKEGNFVSNLWNDRDEKVKAAQLDLNQAIGRLTQRSAQLLVVNTAISKVLSEQQIVLLKQQSLLEEQANRLKLQNEQILEQQVQLAETQKGLNAANQGLMEAKGVTTEQAVKLIGCVTRVEQAESKIDAANEALRSALRNDMQGVVARCDELVSGTLVELRSSQRDFERRQDETTHTWSTRVRDALGQLAASSEAFRSDVTAQLQTHIQATSTAFAAHDVAATQTALVASQVETKQKILESTVASLQAHQAKSAQGNRIALAIVGCVAILSLGWQVAHHFFAA
ncbi:hypothetical protein R70006_03759 [Paraburkholderia domus]|uniref:hypothetical protein n=1 Tax=Paraburkholderia domus TaxID=2793075 RepID=UPI0019114933|nr:hypothetical protein [Paraburkholderia domus]MBK5047229.1 hypothetical protein [Burkholderia sp. R-70006]CAE6766947.1 hypothetical protein R70006_03759 [Paraburkholderia domus]